jgi:hypothetical protein
VTPLMLTRFPAAGRSDGRGGSGRKGDSTGCVDGAVDVNV